MALQNYAAFDLPMNSETGLNLLFLRKKAPEKIL
jgi:hypothetical protein